MTRQGTQALIVHLHDIWSTGDTGSIREVYAENFVAHMPKGWGAAPSRDGHDGIRRAIERLRAGFPDWCEHIDDMVIDEDKVAVRYHSTGTHLGAFAGLTASGRRVEVDELSIFRIEDGRVAEQWCLNDDLAFSKQIRGEPLA
ncbi:ester cyclase [Bradyrhizobium sp.]|uniref:ester cyclase n=1 Tax=Bradyrhizobium sp. TaxID=376 RepID=UPI002388D2D7|nr:ester cyclase [Bradyrhizobium sp.]MDE2377137.1 ester cyclase [Bradyrhizobium sp.]